MKVDLSKQYANRQPKSSPTLDFDAARRRLAEQKAKQASVAASNLTSDGFPTGEPDTVSKSFSERLAGLAGSIASPFIRAGVTAYGIGGGVKNLAEAAGSKIMGNEAGVQRNLQEGLHAVRPEARDLGSLGQFKPITKPGKDAAGVGAELASFAIGGGEAGQVAKQGLKGAIKQAAIQGAKAGATVGGLSSGGQALQEDKGVIDTIKETAKGAGAGALLGGTAGAVLGGVSSKINSAKLAKQSVNSTYALDLVSPKATDKVKQLALKEGRVTEQGLLKASKILPSKRDAQLADAVKDVISPKASQAQNLNLIDAKVKDINSGVKAYVASKKLPFNTNQLKTQLNKGKEELNLVFASDKQAEKTYDAVVKEFLKHVEKKDTAGLFQARQEFDSIPAIKKLLDSQGLGENTKKEVVLTVRGMANRYVASLLPKGNKFRETLLRESKMIEAIGNIAEKNSSTIGMNKLQMLNKKYPLLKWFASGAVGAGGVGVGGALIGSLD